MEINHIGYLVANMEKAIKKFEMLGYQLVSEITHDTIRLVNICFMQLGPYTLELVSPYEKSSVAAGLLKKYKNMPYHICYETDEFDAQLECLEMNGYTKIEEACPAPAIGGRKVCFLMGAGIGMVEILEGA